MLPGHDAKPLRRDWLSQFRRMMSNGGAAAARTALGGGNLLGIQVFTASGVYTPTAGTGFVVVHVQGGGGGSGGTTSTAVGNWACGHSGAGGGYGMKRITSAFSGVTVTIGAGGTAAPGGSFSGGTGGTSSFGSLLSCSGGAGGPGSGAAQAGASVSLGVSAAGGTATGADLSVPGEPGGGAICPNVATVRTPRGGRSFMGPGGAETVVASGTVNGATPSGYGGGASSGANANTVQPNLVGFAGAPGVVIVYEYA